MTKEIYNQKSKTSMKLQKYQSGVVRGSQNNCNICKRQFTLFTKQHQCKRCFRAVCSNCGATKREVFKQNHTKRAHRNCTLCLEDSRYIQDYIKTNKLVFGEMSDLGKRWVNKINPTIKIIMSECSSAFSRDFYESFWDSLNYSLKQFLSRIVITDGYSLVNKVCVAVQQQFPDSKVQNLIYIITFLLCFVAAESAANICIYLLRLSQKIENADAILKEYLQTLNAGKIHFKINLFLNRYSLNCLSAESSIYVVNKIIQKGRIEELFIFFAGVLEINKIDLKGVRDNSMLCDLTLIRNCNVESIVLKTKQLTNVNVTKFINKEIKNNIQNDQLQKQKKSSQSRVTKSDFYSSNLEIQEQKKNKTDSFFTKDIDYFFLQKNQNYNIQNRPENFVDDSFQIRSLMQNSQKARRKLSNSLNGFTNNKEQENQFFKKKHPCQQCSYFQTQLQKYKVSLSMKQTLIDKLQKSLKSYKKNSQTTSSQNFQQDNIISTNQQKIRLIETEKLNKRLQKENKQLKQSLLKMQIQFQIKKRQIGELYLNIQMLKNKLESQKIMDKYKGNDSNKKEQQLLKINQLLKKSLLQKNQLLQMNYKQIKLLTYQVQDQSKQKQLQNLKQQILINKSQKQAFLKKMQQLSFILNNEQNQKIILSEQNFYLKNILKQHNIQLAV